jgi:hypothetical protein
MLITLHQRAFHLSKPDGLLLTSGCHVSYNYSVDKVTRRTFYKIVLKKLCYLYLRIFFQEALCALDI